MAFKFGLPKPFLSLDNFVGLLSKISSNNKLHLLFVYMLPKLLCGLKWVVWISKNIPNDACIHNPTHLK